MSAIVKIMRFLDHLRYPANVPHGRGGRFAPKTSAIAISVKKKSDKDKKDVKPKPKDDEARDGE
jgi:hypothetical protein